MTHVQQDIFGGSVEISGAPRPTPPRKPSAHKTCWESCARCGSMPLATQSKNPRRRVFRTCSLVGNEGKRVFEDEMICDRHLPKPPSVAKPTSPGWEDY